MKKWRIKTSWSVQGSKRGEKEYKKISNGIRRSSDRDNLFNEEYFPMDNREAYDLKWGGNCDGKFFVSCDGRKLDMWDEVTPRHIKKYRKKKFYRRFRKLNKIKFMQEMYRMENKKEYESPLTQDYSVLEYPEWDKLFFECIEAAYKCSGKNKKYWEDIAWKIEDEWALEGRPKIDSEKSDVKEFIESLLPKSASDTELKFRKDIMKLASAFGQSDLDEYEPRHETLQITEKYAIVYYMLDSMEMPYEYNVSGPYKEFKQALQEGIQQHYGPEAHLDEDCIAKQEEYKDAVLGDEIYTIYDEEFFKIERRNFVKYGGAWHVLKRMTGENIDD